MERHLGMGKGAALYRCLMLVLYGFAMARLVTLPDPRVFVGALRSTQFGGESTLMANMPFVAFMLFGMLFALEQPSAYLLALNPFVFVRRVRGWTRLCRYLAIIAGYCVVFAALHLVLTLVVARIPQIAVYLPADGPDVPSLACGAAFAALMLFVFMLADNLSVLGGQRPLGWAIVLMGIILCAAVPAIPRLLMGAALASIPNWVFILVPLALLLVGATAIAWQRVEII